MSPPGIARLVSAISRVLERLPGLVLLRMAHNRVSSGECHGCCQGRQRWRRRNNLLLMFFLIGALFSFWIFRGFEEYGSLERKLEVRNLWQQREQVPGGHNLSYNQLQALAFLFSASDQGTFSECLEKSVADRPARSKLLYALKVLHSEYGQTQAEEYLIREKRDSQEQNLIQNNYISVHSEHPSSKDEDRKVIIPYDTVQADGLRRVKEWKPLPCKKEAVSNTLEHHKILPILLLLLAVVIMGIVVFSRGSSHGRFRKSSDQQFQQKKQLQPQNPKCGGKLMKLILFIGVLIGILASAWIFVILNTDFVQRRKETLANMCDERARMLQDQFNVSMNHVHALAFLVSTFHHEKNPSAIDQKTFAEYTARTQFERPLMSGVAYAVKVLHSDRERFEKEHGWKIKKMDIEDYSPVQDDYFPEKLGPSPVQDEYAPVIFSQETVSHIESIDMMSGKEDRENILRARVTGKGVLTSPFKLLKSNHLGVVLTFAVYNTGLPSNATPEERIEATVGYLGASFDVPSLVEKLLHQLASKQTIVVNLYDTTNASVPIKMYGPNAAGSGEMHISHVDFGDPTRKHEMHCRFNHKAPLPGSAIAISLGVAVIVLLLGHIFYAALNRIEKVEDDYRQMRELKVRAEAADIAKSQFLATVSHEIRTPMNGVLGMLQMLMDTELDPTQQDFAMTAQSSGKALIALINEVLDLAKIESGRLELEAVPFDVRDMLDKVLSLFSDISQVKGIELAVYVSEKVPQILIGDPGRFRQIITNLVGNSVKFTEGGHIFVSVHLIEEARILGNARDQVSKDSTEILKYGKEKSYDTLSGFQVVERWKSWENFSLFKSPTVVTGSITLVVTVEDTGVGIPQDAQSRIFTPFMQADSSTSRTYGGTGIGLGISKCLVNLMGGEIGFVSKPGVGSSFSFTAVLSEGQKNTSDTKRHQSDSSISDFQGMKGLVADGRSIRAEVTKYHLQRLGIHVKIVNSQDSAISAMMDASKSTGEHLNMMIVDKEAWGKGSGLAFPLPLVELTQTGILRPQERLPKMFLLATSLSPREVDDLKSAGYADCIKKPLRLSMIAACLQKALGVDITRQQGKTQPLGLRSLLNGKHILVVDDNAVNRRVAAGVLKKFGAVVTCADSGKAAIGMLQPPHKFDACFMDVQMPEMDGFEATRQIRSMENKVNQLIKSGKVSLETYGNVSNWHVPILAMTADVIQATYAECLRCGMDDYVSKPFEEQQLYSAVAHFFQSDKEDGFIEFSNFLK